MLGAKAIRIAAAMAMTVALSACGGQEENEEAKSATSAAQMTTEAPAPAPEATTEVPAPEKGKAPSPRELVGTWSKVGLPLLMWRFNSDGTFAFDRTNLDAPHSRGTYELDGEKIRFVAMGVGCVDHWAWNAAIVEMDADRFDDELHIAFVDPACGQIAGVEWTFLRIPG